MYDTAKYLIHADITAEGVVERSDVVGAIFGQTEGLLGEELDLRDLQDSSKVGRIDVEIDSEAGRSFGTVTIASGLDRVETAILAAGLETIERVGPCQAALAVRDIEDVRAAKRRQVVDRATELVQEGFGDGIATSQDLIEQVRSAVRVEDITEYEGLPAGPRVVDSDAIIVVEGRADVLQLLKYGVKNAIAVEGTNVPDAVADLTDDRTVTTFLDGDRGGDLILKELGQVGRIDFVATAPGGRSVEDLSRGEVMAALREKVPFEDVIDETATDEAAAADETDATVAVTDGAAVSQPAPSSDPPEPATRSDDATEDSDSATRAEAGTDGPSEAVTEREAETGAVQQTVPATPETLRGHVKQVVGEGTGGVRLLSEEFDTLEEGAADEAFELVRAAEPAPHAVVLDADLTQRLLDVAAQRGVTQIVARATDSFVKQPTSVRVRTAEQLLSG